MADTVLTNYSTVSLPISWLVTPNYWKYWISGGTLKSDYSGVCLECRVCVCCLRSSQGGSEISLPFLYQSKNTTECTFCATIWLCSARLAQNYWLVCTNTEPDNWACLSNVQPDFIETVLYSLSANKAAWQVNKQYQVMSYTLLRVLLSTD